MGSARYNYIHENSFLNNEYGIKFEDNEWTGASSKLNIISKNTISNNQIYGIHIAHRREETHKDNIIYQNNFLNNGNSTEGGNAYDICNNTWYDPLLKVGNFWDDYEEKYPDAERVIRSLLPDYWDIPYDIPDDNIYDEDKQDLYPLASQYDSSQIDIYQDQQSSQQEIINEILGLSAPAGGPTSN